MKQGNQMDNKVETLKYAHKPAAAASEGEPALQGKQLAENEQLFDELGILLESRRRFLIQTAAAGVGVLSLQALAEPYAFGAQPAAYPAV